MSNMRIRTMFLLVTALAVMFLLACGGGSDSKQPNIEATVEARVNEQLVSATAEARDKLVSATVEARVAAKLATPMPTATPFILHAETTAAEYYIQGREIYGPGFDQYPAGRLPAFISIIYFTRAIELYQENITPDECSDYKSVSKNTEGYYQYPTTQTGRPYITTEHGECTLEQFYLFRGRAYKEATYKDSNKESKKYAKALSDFDKVLELDPDNQDVINDRSNLLKEHPELKP